MHLEYFMKGIVAMSSVAYIFFYLPSSCSGLKLGQGGIKCISTIPVYVIGEPIRSVIRIEALPAAWIFAVAITSYWC